MKVSMENLWLGVPGYVEYVNNRKWACTQMDSVLTEIYKCSGQRVINVFLDYLYCIFQ